MKKRLKHLNWAYTYSFFPSLLSFIVLDFAGVIDLSQNRGVHIIVSFNDLRDMICRWHFLVHQEMQMKTHSLVKWGALVTTFLYF